MNILIKNTFIINAIYNVFIIYNYIFFCKFEKSRLFSQEQ